MKLKDILSKKQQLGIRNDKMANEIESSEYCELDPIKDKAKDSIDWEGLALKMAHKK